MARVKLHKWSEEQREYLLEIVRGRTVSEITDMINKKFNINLVPTQVESAKTRYGAKSVIDGTFKSKHEP